MFRYPDRYIPLPWQIYITLASGRYIFPYPLADIFPYPGRYIFSNPLADIFPCPLADIFPYPLGDIFPYPGRYIFPYPLADIFPYPGRYIFPYPLADIFHYPLADIFPYPGRYIFYYPLADIYSPTLWQIHSPTLWQIYSPTLWQIYSLTLADIYSPTLWQIYSLTLWQIYSPRTKKLGFPSYWIPPPVHWRKHQICMADQAALTPHRLDHVNATVCSSWFTKPIWSILAKTHKVHLNTRNILQGPTLLYTPVYYQDTEVCKLLNFNPEL